MKNTWEWQVQDKNWQQLKERYSELAGKSDESQEARLSILDKLDPARRTLVDSYSRSMIIEENPEWIKKALDEAETKEEEVALRESGGKMPFEGVKNQSALLALIDSAPLNEYSDALAAFSEDGVHVYRIQVLDRSKPEVILSFAEAKKDGTLDKMLDKTLESSYSRLRTKESALFLKEDGEWKPFKEVKENVAALYFEPLFSKLDRDIEVYREKMPHAVDWNSREKARLAVSLLPFVDQARTALQANSEDVGEWIQQVTAAAPASVASTGPAQFKLVKNRERLVRRDPSFVANPAVAFSLNIGVTSPLAVYQQSGPSFFTVIEKGFLPYSEQLKAKVLEERELLGKEALVQLGRHLLSEMQEKGAIDLDAVRPLQTSETAAKPSTDASEEK